MSKVVRSNGYRPNHKRVVPYMGCKSHSTIKSKRKYITPINGTPVYKHIYKTKHLMSMLKIRSISTLRKPTTNSKRRQY